MDKRNLKKKKKKKKKMKMKFSFRKSSKSLGSGSDLDSRRRQSGGDASSSGGQGMKTRLQLKLLAGLTWEANAPKTVTTGGRKAEKGSSTKAEQQQQQQLTTTSSLVPPPLWPDLDTLQGCTDFLKSSGLNTHALGHAASMVDHFKGSYQMGDSSLPDELRLEAWKGTLRRIVKTLVDQLLACNPRLESSCSAAGSRNNEEEHNMKQLWRACEAWIFGAVYDKIMGACKQMFGQNDKLLDQTLLKLDKVDPLVLGVRGEFKEFVLGEALHQFRTINRLRTPLEKAVCLRKTVNCIMEGIQSVITSCKGTQADTDGLLPCTDDLLSFMLLLMAKARVTNLQANACYMDNFLSLSNQYGEEGELRYHVTNFVAACSYLNSEEFQKQVTELAPSPISKSNSSPSGGGGAGGRGSGSSPANEDHHSSSRHGSFSVDSPPVHARSSNLFDEFQQAHMSSPIKTAYSRSNTHEADVHTMSPGDILSMNLFGSPLMSTSPASEFRAVQGSSSCMLELPVRRSISDKTLNSGTNAPGLSGGSPEFILAPTYQ